MVQKLKEVLSRQQFEIVIQAKIGSKVSTSIFKLLK
jgi:translation elongation factor EF-4